MMACRAPLGFEGNTSEYVFGGRTGWRRMDRLSRRLNRTGGNPAVDLELELEGENRPKSMTWLSSGERKYVFMQNAKIESASSRGRSTDGSKKSPGIGGAVLCAIKWSGRSTSHRSPSKPSGPSKRELLSEAENSEWEELPSSPCTSFSPEFRPAGISIRSNFVFFLWQGGAKPQGDVSESKIPGGSLEILLLRLSWGLQGWDAAGTRMG